MLQQDSSRGWMRKRKSQPEPYQTRKKINLFSLSLYMNILLPQKPTLHWFRDFYPPASLDLENGVEIRIPQPTCLSIYSSFSDYGRSSVECGRSRGPGFPVKRNGAAEATPLRGRVPDRRR